MNWKSIRLELGKTHEFPNGSASRAYLMRLPLTDDGVIDETAVVQRPEQATVRRLWPSEPDLSGHIRRMDGRWACVAQRNLETPTVFSEFDCLPLSEGAMLMLQERNGPPMPFRVAKLRALG